MKFSTVPAAIASALVLGAVQPVLAEQHLGHRVAHTHYGKRNVHSHAGLHAEASLKERHPTEAPQPLDKREPQSAHALSLPALFTRDRPESIAERSPVDDATAVPKDVTKRAVCKLPNDPDLVPVPGNDGGWAMAPDVQCTAGSWCPIACVPGKVMAQWKPGTTYVYPESMDGGLYCGSDGTAQKGFPGQPYCVEGTGAVAAVNKCGSVVSFCQTVLPGDEGMYIPTDVHSSAVLAVPGPSYWDGTASQYVSSPFDCSLTMCVC